MITTMDASGRLVIPRDVRREAALEPGAPLEVRVRDGVVEIEPQPAKVSLQRRGGLVIATPAGRVPPLRAATVERVRRELASRRHRR